MKYEYYPKRRTEQERRELNEQILRLLQSEACEQAGVTDEDIFNRYTGDGGLHGLRRSDYENYNAFSAAKKELENGQFFTPPPLCEMIVSALRLTDTDLVADLTCGMGNFFNFLPNENTAYGCEVDPNACAVARKLYPQAHIVQGDIRDYEPQVHFDVVLGNPPFHLRWVMPDATVMTSHQYYCLKAAKLLKPLGILAVIVPASFLADSFSDKGAIRMLESRFSFLGQVMLPEHAFSDSGVDGFPTKLQFWQKKSTAADWAPKRYSTDCADIYIPSGHPVMAATALYEKFVMVAKADLAGNRNKVFLELAQLKTTKSTFLYQVKKYLYQIRSHPVTREKYDACFAYVHRFYTQRQPADMPYEEWQRVQLTLQPLDVLVQLAHISRQLLFLLLQGKKHGQLPKLCLSQQHRRRILVRRPQLSPQAFKDQVAIRFHIGRRRFCENMILPEVPFQSDQFFFIGHVTVDTADDCLVFRISVKAAEVDPVNVHDRHVVPPLRFIVDRNDFLAVVPPVILGIIVRGLDLKDG